VNFNPCNRSRSIVAGITALTMFSVAGAAAAETAPEVAVPTGWSGSLGSGVASQATYLGSPNRRTNAIPMVELSWTTAHYGSFQLGQQGAGWIFPQLSGLTVGVMVVPDGGRYEARHNGLVPYGDKRLEGMGDVKSSPEAGVTLGYGPLSVSVRQGLSAKGHDGLVVDIGAEHGMQVTPRLGLSVGVGARWSDGHYMQSYFGVTDEQAAASRFEAYSAGKGFNSAQATVSAQFRLMGSWAAMAGVNYSRLLGDAKDSPIAEKDGSASVFAGLTWNFD
jgi:outer membrane scaffolding protein for murein synthesis (MipA/OmpV family)